MAILGLALGVLAVDPHEWPARIEAWLNLLGWVGVILIILGVTLSIAWLTGRWPGKTLERFDSIDSVKRRISQIIQQAQSHDGRSTHQVRIIVLAGIYTLRYLKEIVSEHLTEEGDHWRIGVLLLGPRSSDVSRLHEGTREHILGSLNDLAKVKAEAEAQNWPVDVEWHTYEELSLPWYGVLIDDDDLFFGYSAWSGVDKHRPRADKPPQLNTQRRTMFHATRKAISGPELIESFKGWFDYHWNLKSRLASENGDGTRGEEHPGAVEEKSSDV